MTIIKENDLREFVKWYATHHGRLQEDESVFLTCMCGWFHSYPTAMKAELARMKTLGLVTTNNQIITITHQDDNYEHI